MFERISPEKAGISSKKVLGFIKTLEKYNFNTHSLILARGNCIISECYYAPFHKDFLHRMYSVSKSFVSIAIGLLAEDNLLSLDDKFIKYFPEYTDPKKCSKFLSEMTIKEALTMETCNAGQLDWFHCATDDRTKLYFEWKPDYMSGSLFRYDSPVSYMLCVIAEKLSGKPFLEFLKERFLIDIGFSKNSYCLKCPGGHSFGDSGVMCTSLDLLRFARFVMNGGVWEGKRYMNEDYLKSATSKQVANSIYGDYSYSSFGYGYQIWCAPDGGFAFIGMGDQFAICDRTHDFIMIINSDNQGNSNSRFILYHALYEDIIGNLGDPLPEDKEAFDELKNYETSRKLNFAKGALSSSFSKELSGSLYSLAKNDMEIENISFEFEDKKGIIYYTNAQGKKQLKFGFGYNEFQKFPQTGYSDMTAGAPSPGNMYDCAVSGEWLEPKKLHLKIQAIDKYFGILDMVFSFKGDGISVVMEKTAEAFFEEYKGHAAGVININK